MLRALYMDDSYQKEFESVVVSVKDGRFVVLEDTAFYPNGGGQPFDTGIIMRGDEVFKVVFVGKFGSSISHEVDRPGLRPGDRVKGVVDWPRRFAHMRAHTASHVLSAIMHDDYGAKITGNQLSEGRIRIDFSLESFDRDIIDAVVAKANVILARGLPVSISYLPREVALSVPSLVKLAGALPPQVDELRIVSIGDPENPADRQADGGTHVRSTAEIGALTLIKADNKGRNNRRVYVAVSEVTYSEEPKK